MDKDDKAAVLVVLGFVIIIIAIAVTLTICHEVTETGNAKRCAEYNYNCGGEQR